MKLLFTGCFFGILLLMAGIELAGWGHGSYFFLAITSAPLGPAWIGMPLLWGGIGWLLSKSAFPRYRKAFVGLMLLHYLTALLLALYPNSPYRDLAYLHGRYGWLFCAFTLYLFVQGTFWYLYFLKNRKWLVRNEAHTAK